MLSYSYQKVWGFLERSVKTPSMKKYTLLFAILFFFGHSLGFALTESEQNNIRIFETTADSVVFITNVKRFQGFNYNPVEKNQGTGSGFVWDKQGHIITNFHVVYGGDVFYVTLRDQSRHKAKVVGVEPKKDLAVLKIETKKVIGSLKPIQIGQSTDLRVGQKAIAIGNPFGLDYSLTVGVISALDREIESLIRGVTIREVIQTDASINPGNSGGPLLDSSGKLIGMNTAIYSQSGQSAGIGFAVPVKFIKKIVPQIIRYGKAIQPGLGVNLLPDHIARQYTDIPGVVVNRVTPGSAADKAGIRGMNVDTLGGRVLGDIITAIDNTPIKDFDDISNALDQYKVGDIVSVTVYRDSKPVKLRVKLQKLI